MRPVVAQFLATLSPDLRRSEVERTRPDLLPSMQPWGREWRAYAHHRGVPCPPALVELADAMADVYIHVDDAHGWDLLTPESAEVARRLLVQLAPEFPELTERAQLVPVFGQDGDLFLLGSDGRIHAFTHDDWEHDEEVLADFEALLRRLARLEG